MPPMAESRLTRPKRSRWSPSPPPPATARFSADDIQDVVSFPRSFLRRLKPKTIGNRRDWTRFVVVTLDEQNAAGMSPQLLPGAQVLIDRHYNSPPRDHRLT